MSEKTACVILAAGDGVRMRSRLPKVLHPICGQPMVFYPVALALRCRFHPLVVVVSARGEPVRRAIRERFGRRVEFVVQERQLGTAHAVLAARERLRHFSGRLAVLYGDVPLIEAADLAAARRAARGAEVVFLTCRPHDPAGYGRVVRGPSGEVVKIVEHRDATAAERAIGEVNAGIYLVRAAVLFELLGRVGRKNRQGEYYLTDIVELAIRHGLGVRAIERPGADRILGINDRLQLGRAEQEMNARLAEGLMRAGVTLIAPAATWLTPEVSCGADTVIFPGCHFRGRVRIGRGCRLGPAAVLEDCTLGDDVEVLAFSHLAGCRVLSGARVGPFARLRPGTVIEAGARVGNFVEVKNTRLGAGAKANHLTYLGDTEVGPGANIGAGTITCNYDGRQKHRTLIGAGAFIGSDTQLVAPVKVGEGAVVGAGTTVTVDVPAEALAVSRVPQKNIRGYGRRLRKKR